MIVEPKVLLTNITNIKGKAGPPPTRGDKGKTDFGKAVIGVPVETAVGRMLTI